MTIEQLARVIHEAGRTTGFESVDWDALEDNQREERRVRAASILDRYVVYPKRKTRAEMTGNKVESIS